MRSITDAKAMARSLKAALARRQIEISHGAALDLVAAQCGFADWNVLSARLPAETAIRFGAASPVLRIFDAAKAKDFYVGFLGFAWDWEHRFEPGLPLYAQVSRAGLVLHLSEHHGDASPGATVFVTVAGLRDFQRELAGKDYAYARPGIEDQPWGAQMTVTDPFSNRIRFNEAPASG